MNSKNRLSSHLIILIYTLNNIDLNSKNIGYYSRGFIRRAFTFNIDKYSSKLNYFYLFFIK
ncbi:hypothetical protein CV657_05905 [Borreliella burgdorferi]|uniref:Uncharacterized protein n=2 Tax=Borreliella burgdorferi TaxID=139 RepID=O50664_BORBU|nr:conserved hypothetical protein [Borreliella burgdorferi B31]ADQ31232.1 conserved hypothetical protein [Borreliella burgdorferi JD1]PNL81682.1 hypothetical protein A6J35_006855 [Borreliella burgdorferi]PRQ93293.1 hypothetical protein CV682_05885 [Borreliella burgdorferi]PRQ94673.1 hypothetical protein CV688_05985 [Borreliella burgdorferi]